MRTIASETERLGLTPHYKEVETKREMVWGPDLHESPCNIPVGTKLTIYWSKNNPSRVYFEYAGHLRCTRVSLMHKTFCGKFSKMPSATTLQKWEWDGGFCKTVLGEKTEPDGHGPSGAPSWMLVAGII